MKEQFATAYYCGGDNFVDNIPRDVIPAPEKAPFYITSAGKFRAFQQGTMNVHENADGEIIAQGQSVAYSRWGVDNHKHDWLRKASIVEIMID